MTESWWRGTLFWEKPARAFLEAFQVLLERSRSNEPAGRLGNAELGEV